MIGLANDTFLRAARGESGCATPVWFMRQAGRALPAYRTVRGRHSFLEIARTPELAAEVTAQPVEALGVDAAILFSDILLPLQALGVEVAFSPAPVLERAFDPAAGTGFFRIPDPRRDYAYLAAAVRACLDRLAGRVPLIGFAGAPFTLAAYLVEGGGSQSWPRTRAWMHTEPARFSELLFFLAERVIEWLRIQIEAGVHACQLFDSWAGILSPRDMERFALPAARRVFENLPVPEDFPTIYFAPGAGGSLEAQARCGARVLGLDWRVELGRVRAEHPSLPLQGNLDPGILLGSPGEIERAIRSVLEGAGGGGAHIFNLGHGLLPETPLENARLAVRLVHEIAAGEGF